MFSKRQGLSSSLIFLFILAGGIISTGLAITSPWSQKKSELPVFSLSAQEEPLRKVLEKISGASGYEIILDGDSGELPVSVTLKNVTLGEALKKVLADLNYVAIWEEEDKKISLTMYNLGKSRKTVKTQREISHDNANSRFSIRPSSETEKQGGATVSDTGVSGTNDKKSKQSGDFEVSITGKNTNFVQGSKTTID